MNGVNCHKYRHLCNELRNLSSGLYLTVAPWDDTSEDAKIAKISLSKTIRIQYNLEALQFPGKSQCTVVDPRKNSPH